MRRVVGGLVAAGALLASGWVGAVVFGPSFASAQTSTTTDPVTPAAPGVHDDSCHFGVRGPEGADLEAAASAIGISRGDLLAALQGGQTIAQVAQAHNVDVQKVIDALVASAKTHLSEAVTAGKLTQAQADEKLASLTEHIAAVVNGQFKLGVRGGPETKRRMPFDKGAELEAAASAIGISRSDLLAALQGGQTIAQVAQAHNVDVQKVIDALVASAKTHLSEAVTAGKLTQAQADDLLAHVAERVTAMVNGQVPPGGPGKFRFHHEGDSGPAPVPPAPPAAQPSTFTA